MMQWPESMVNRIVSILYKYHISLGFAQIQNESIQSVSILYKYHISLNLKTHKLNRNVGVDPFISIIFPIGDGYYFDSIRFI